MRQGQRGRHLADGQDGQQDEREQVPGGDVVDLAERAELACRRYCVVDTGAADEPEEEEDEHGDDEGGHGGPDLSLDVLVDVDPDHLCGEDRRLRQR